MGYNGKEFREPCNGGESLVASMSNLLVTGGAGAGAGARDQSTSDQSHSNLNPHAAEFVPKAKEMSSSRLDRTDSSNSNASDDEYRRLPDDLDLGDLVETFEGSSSAAATAAVAAGFVRPLQEQQVRWSDEWGAFPEDLATTEVVDPIAVLGSEFPGFASESLAEIYYANGGDLALTMDLLSELELQNEGVMAQQFQVPPPSSRDFPALAGLETIQLSGRASSFGSESRSVPDFAAAVRKQAAAQQLAQLQFERNGGVDFARGLSQAGGFARVSHTERLDPFPVQPPATWLDTGDSVSNMYADMREEARDHARVRNAYFDQARQAYLIGNKALAKKLSAKGQWHNEQMKAAHSKAGDAIFYQRNANTLVHNNSSPGQPHMIDLHGLHVGEAIPVLKREIAQLRCTRQQRASSVFICVGTGHHTKGSRTPSRLPAAVQRYLLEEEHLHFTEPQAGMLRIIIR